jgi:cytochrome c oxidase cbb3-type subunit 3
LQVEELAIETEEGERRKAKYLANSPNAIDENNITTMEGITAAAGAGIFAKNCVACHGAAGEGNAVGPNLTDKYWIHGGGLVNVFKSVKYGWPEKGMKSWQAEMSSLEMAQVSAYVASLQGSNPANAKEAQGEIWSEGGAEIAVDSAVGE